MAWLGKARRGKAWEVADLNKNCQQISAFDECFYLCMALYGQV